LKRYIPIAIAALALAACAGSPQTKATNAVAVACDAYQEVLSKAADNKARLSSGQIQTIDRVNKVTDAVCLPGSPIDPAASVAVVESAIKTVREIVK
jgi:PBP1b-binding outer membrane lipoprotein LpoB